jgi:hypothetical protein
MCDPDKIKPEPIPGLPEELPKGEEILWRGSPDWKSLALHVFHVRAVSIYFAILLIWQVSAGVIDGVSFNVALANSLHLIPMAAAALGLLCLLAWLIARATIYTVTTDRVVIRSGVALPKAINIPFSKIGSAGVNLRKSGTGDIPLQITGPDRAAYVPLWPSARPWKLANAEPMLRGIPDAAACADILAKALAAKAGQPAKRVAVAEAETLRPSATPQDALPGQAAAAN